MCLQRTFGGWFDAILDSIRLTGRRTPGQTPIAVASLVLLGSSGCGYTHVKGAGAAYSPTYADLHTKVFAPKCVSCHQPSNASAGIDLTTYTSVMAAMNVVVPRNPESSRMYQQVSQGLMPLGGPPLPAPAVTRLTIGSMPVPPTTRRSYLPIDRLHHRFGVA